MNSQNKKLFIGMTLVVCAFCAGPVRADNESAGTQKTELNQLRGVERTQLAQLKALRAQKGQADREFVRILAQRRALEHKKNPSAADRAEIQRLKGTEKALENTRRSDEASYLALEARLRGTAGNYHADEKEHSHKKSH